MFNLDIFMVIGIVQPKAVNKKVLLENLQVLLISDIILFVGKYSTFLMEI